MVGHGRPTADVQAVWSRFFFFFYELAFFFLFVCLFVCLLLLVVVFCISQMLSCTFSVVFVQSCLPQCNSNVAPSMASPIVNAVVH